MMQLLRPHIIIIVFLFSIFIPITVCLAEDGNHYRSTKGGDIVVALDGSGDFSTIQGALNSAQKGDIIIINTGTYYEQIHVNKQVEIIGMEKDNTIIHGENRTNVITIFHDFCKISDLTIQYCGGNKTNPFIAGINIQANGVIIEDCIFRSNQNGVIIDDQHGCSILRSHFFNNIGGIDIDNSEGCTVEHNVIVGGKSGVTVYESSEITIQWNNISKTTVFGIYIQNSHDCIVIGNTLFDNNGSHGGDIHLLFNENTEVSGNSGDVYIADDTVGASICCNILVVVIPITILLLLLVINSVLHRKE